MKDWLAMRTVSVAKKGSWERMGRGRRAAMPCCFALRSRRTCLALHEHYHLGHGAYAVRPLHRGWDISSRRTCDGCASGGEPDTLV